MFGREYSGDSESPTKTLHYITHIFGRTDNQKPVKTTRKNVRRENRDRRKFTTDLPDAPPGLSLQERWEWYKNNVLNTEKFNGSQSETMQKLPKN